jgi:hypothetical protein
MSSQFPPQPPSHFAPAPLQQPPSNTFDFVKAFTFVFNDPDWVKKTLLGGLFYMLAMFIVGAFIVFGYLAQMMRNVVAGMERPLPEWNNIGGYLVEGLKLSLICIVWYAPLIALALLFVVPVAMLGDPDTEGAAAGLMSCGIGLVILLTLLISLLLPAALSLAVVRERASAAFEFGTIIAFIRANAMNYVLAIVVYLISNTLSQFGVILLCVGIFFTVFLSLVMTAWAFAETYRLSSVK